MHFLEDHRSTAVQFKFVWLTFKASFDLAPAYVFCLFSLSFLPFSLCSGPKWKDLNLKLPNLPIFSLLPSLFGVLSPNLARQTPRSPASFFPQSYSQALLLLGSCVLVTSTSTSHPHTMHIFFLSNHPQHLPLCLSC